MRRAGGQGRPPRGLAQGRTAHRRRQSVRVRPPILNRPAARDSAVCACLFPPFGAETRCFVEEPDATFSLVDPHFDQALGGHVAIPVA